MTDLSSDSETLSSLLKVSNNIYLEHLTSLTLPTLLSEPSVLQTQHHHLTSSLTSLTHTSYPTFISLHSSTSALSSSLSDFSSSLDDLIGTSLPALEASVGNWDAGTGNVLAERRKTLTVLESHDKLRDLLDIPVLINTCVRNAYFAEALSLAAHARGLLRSYGSKPTPLILSSVLAEVDVAVNQMLVSLLATLHEPNRKLPALWKAVNFLRKMSTDGHGKADVGVGSEEEIALAFLSGRELCLKGSLEPLRRDIFRIVSVGVGTKSEADKKSTARGSEAGPREISERDKDDLAKYITKYIGLWREGVYDIVTQYEPIFLATPSSNPNEQEKEQSAAVTANLHNLLSTYVSHALRTHLLPIISSSDSSNFSPLTCLPIHSLPPLLTQLTYCATALARVGADFHTTVARSMGDAVVHIFSRDIISIEHRFVATLEKYTSTKTKKGKEEKDRRSSTSRDIATTPRMPSKWLLASSMVPDAPPVLPTTPNSTALSHNPPSILTSYPPLARHANACIEIINALRACAPVGAVGGYTQFASDGEPEGISSLSPMEATSIFHILRQALAREGEAVHAYVQEVVDADAEARGQEKDGADAVEERRKVLNESAHALSFARVFFEVWVPWTVRAVSEGIFGISTMEGIDAMEESGSDELAKVVRQWRVWLQAFEGRRTGDLSNGDEGSDSGTGYEV